MIIWFFAVRFCFLKLTLLMYDMSHILQRPSWYDCVFIEFLAFLWKLTQALVLYLYIFELHIIEGLPENPFWHFYSHLLSRRAFWDFTVTVIVLNKVISWLKGVWLHFCALWSIVLACPFKMQVFQINDWFLDFTLLGHYTNLHCSKKIIPMYVHLSWQVSEVTQYS